MMAAKGSTSAGSSPSAPGALFCRACTAPCPNVEFVSGKLVLTRVTAPCNDVRVYLAHRAARICCPIVGSRCQVGRVLPAATGDTGRVTDAGRSERCGCARAEAGYGHHEV